MNPIKELCPECGLCCNGVLFGDVHLVRGDDPLALESAGLRLSHINGHSQFQQPCECFDGRLCAIYEQRPVRCRTFDCHTLKQTRLGEINMNEGLKRIQHAKKLASEVAGRLCALGQTDASVSMTARYKEVMQSPIDLSVGEEEAEQRGQLMLAVHDLMQCVQRDFLE